MGKEARARAGETSTSAVDEQQLAKIHDDVKRMNHSERIIFWDKRQAAKVHVDADGNILGDADKVDGEWPEGSKVVRAPHVVLCPNDASHGVLTINGAGSLLMCGARKGGAWCTGSQPVSL